MSFYSVPRMFDVPEAGTPGWQDAPVPGWGMNPLRAGPARVGVGGCGCSAKGTGAFLDNTLPRYTQVGADAAEEKYSQPMLIGVAAGAATIGIVAGMLLAHLWEESRKP